MKKLVMTVLCLLSLAGACATTPEPAYPDEEQIRENAEESHQNLRKEEKKHQ